VGAADARSGRIPRWIGWIAYDAGLPEASRDTRAAPRRGPLVWLGRYDALAAFDGVHGEAWIAGDDARACARLRERIAAGGAPSARVGACTVDAPELHLLAIARALEHIAAGEVYQVNLARRWSAPFDGDALALFLAMRRASPVPLGFFVDTGAHAVASRTMERFLEWEGPGGRLASRPIKGTIARAGADDDEARTLASDDKERAEHAMIVDLVRNDLGRVAETGTVRVERVMEVEPYAKLSHLVSTIASRTRRDTTLRDVFEATFPPGSVTGAPKIAATRIIDALEPHARGAYCGAVGFVDRAGGASFAVAIRTAQVHGGHVTYHAGGGIVSASVPERELAETELKARAFLDAIESLPPSDQSQPLREPAEEA
jgi:anthranilate/para-aminobenzoate synthase component I